MLFSCQLQKEVEGKAVEVPVEGTGQELFASSFIESYAFVPLETNQDCLIASIDKVKKVKDKFYILDRTNNAIFIFKETGEYFQTLFKVGNGPGEYLQLMDFDVEDDNLYILDFARQAILKYNEDLSYEGMVKYRTFASQFLVAGEKIFLYNEPSGQKDDYRFSLIDKNGNYIENVLPREGQATYNYGGIGVFSKANNTPFISPIYGNIIYKGDEFDKEYQIRFSERAFPVAESIESYDILSPVFTYLVKEHFFVTDHYVIFDYTCDGERCHALYEKAGDRTLGAGKVKNDLIADFRFFPQWGNDGLLMDAVNPDLLHEYFSFLLGRAELSGVKDGDNPVLVIYRVN